MSDSPDPPASVLQTLRVVDVRGVVHTLGAEPVYPDEHAVFTTLRAPDRRPHPFCARSLLMRIEARARTTGTRVVVAVGADTSSFAEPLAVADTLVGAAIPCGALTLHLIDDVDVIAGAARPANAVSAAFCAAIVGARETLDTLAGSPLELARTADGGMHVRATGWVCGPHVLLAALIAAGTRMPCEASAEREDPDAVERALLGDAVVEARTAESAEFPLGVLRKDVSFPGP